MKKSFIALACGATAMLLSGCATDLATAIPGNYLDRTMDQNFRAQLNKELIGISKEKFTDIFYSEDDCKYLDACTYRHFPMDNSDMVLLEKDTRFGGRFIDNKFTNITWFGEESTYNDQRLYVSKARFNRWLKTKLTEDEYRAKVLAGKIKDEYTIPAYAYDYDPDIKLSSYAKLSFLNSTLKSAQDIASNKSNCPLTKTSNNKFDIYQNDFPCHLDSVGTNCNFASFYTKTSFFVKKGGNINSALEKVVQKAIVKEDASEKDKACSLDHGFNFLISDVSNLPADQSKGPLIRIKGQGYVHSYFRPNNGKEIYEIYERTSNYSKTPAELLTLIKSAKF